MYLIRESEQDQGRCWSLSILDYNEDKQRHTKHYRIRKIDDGGCYISTRNRFNSLDDLVVFYSSKCFVLEEVLWTLVVGFFLWGVRDTDIDSESCLEIVFCTF